MKLLFLLVLCIISVLVSSCEDGWTRYNKHCYKKFNAPHIKAQEANNFCRQFGANLSSVRDENERQFIFEFTTSGWAKDISHQTLIGGYRDTAKSIWKWYDGTPFTQYDLFRYGEPKSSGLSLILRSDPYVDGGTFHGYFSSTSHTGPAHLLVCRKEDAKASKCEDKWTAFGANCYRRFSDSSIQNGFANSICKNHGATLTSVTSEQEKRFIMELSDTGRRSYPEKATVVGGYRESPNHPWKWYDGKPFEQQHMFLTTGQLKQGKQLCLRLRSDTPLLDGPYWPTTHGYFIDRPCNLKAFIFVCKKPGGPVCDAKTMTEIDGKCTCNSDLVDIVDTNLPEAKNYSRGEKCVKGMCHSVKDSTSILFMIDSSQSITAERWPSMVKFVKQGASKLPNSFRVGFMKFSTKVSDKKWVEPKWTKDEYEDSVPVKYDSGLTNTPLALQLAKEMFKSDENRNKIAVLITDGLPFADDYDSEAEALNATKKAARELRSDGVRLTVMGVGPEIIRGVEQVVQWLKNPKTDYFSFYETVDCLKGTDMDKLLQVVCRRD